jgi:RHS repeat-associated protein
MACRNRRVNDNCGSIEPGNRTKYTYDAAGDLTSEFVSGTPPANPCTTCYIVSDTLGSTRLMMDASTGNVVALHDYLPFGEEIAGAPARPGTLYGGTDNPRQKFTGKERDTESGLDFFGARYFSGAQGRFITPDWSEKIEAIPYANLKNPQSLNLYIYVLNSPLSWKDVDGHFWQELGNWLVGSGWKTNKQLDPPPPPAPPPPPLPTPAPLTYKKEVPSPSAESKLGKLLNCTNKCMAPQPLTVNSTSESIPGHPEIHGPDTPHGKGEAADLKTGATNAREGMMCAGYCGAGYGQNEYAHPSPHATGPHVHIQTGPGRGGSRGDLPSQPTPSSNDGEEDK